MLVTECYMVLVLLVGSFAVINVNFVAIYAWFIYKCFSSVLFFTDSKWLSMD